MPKIEQIYTLVNAVAKQAFGSDAITTVDTSTLVALGDFVLKSDENTDAFRHALVDRIGKTIMSVREYSPDYGNIVKHPFEYGVILQKIYIDLPDASENNAWNIGNENYSARFAPVYPPDFKQKLFNKIATMEIDVTIPDKLLSTAFLNEKSMAVMIEGVFVAVENRMRVAIENTIDLTRASFIARKLQDKTAHPMGAINLLHEYNTETNSSLTVAGALRDTGFLKWSSMQINLYVNRMKRISTLFNSEGYKRHTPLENLSVVLLDNYVSATSSYLEADTFHNDLVKLPNFTSVPYWQGCGTSYAFDDISSIDIKLDDETTVKQAGIIGVLYDDEAIGVTIDKPRTTSERNNHDEYTNYYHKFNKGFYNDLSENGIVFYLAEA